MKAQTATSSLRGVPALNTERRAPTWLDGSKSKLSVRQVVGRLWVALGAYRLRLAGIGALASTTALLEAATLVFIATLVQVLATDGEKVKRVLVPLVNVELVLTVPMLFALAAAAVVGRATFHVLSTTSSSRMQIRYEAHHRERLFAVFMDADWSIQSEARSGELQTLLTTSISLTRKTLGAVTNSLVALSNVLVLVVVALTVHAPTVFAMGVIGVVLFSVLRPLSQRARKLSFSKAELNIEYIGRVNDAVTMAREVRVFGVATVFKQLIEKLVWRSAGLSMRSQLLEGLVPVAYQTTAFLALLAGLFGVWLSGATVLASLGVAVILLLRALTHGQVLQAVYHAVVETMPYLDQLDDYEARHRSVPHHEGTATLESVEHVAMKGVGFSYRPPTQTLDDVGFAMTRGEALGIVGPSGSGKSTLVQLLLRLRRPASGTFEVNGRDASDYGTVAWAKKVAYVPQDAQLLDDTILANVSFLRDGITREQIVKACKLAEMHDEITALPRGYETVVGERGSTLSGGQKQRLCIARALVGEPDLLILDEPTSALDVHSEAKIQAALEGLRRQLSMVIVAHRLSTLSICDKLLVLRDGRVEAFGRLEDIKRDNTYFASALALSGVG